MTSRVYSNGQAYADPLPPQNLEAERAVLCGLLLEPDRFDEILEIVEPDHFYRDTHASVFRAMVDLHKQGKPVDTVTLADELSHRDQHQFNVTRVTDLFLEITGVVPHGANCAYHAEIVRALAVARQVIQAGTETVRDAYSAKFTPQELRERSEKRFRDIDPANKSRNLVKADFATLADVRREATGNGWLWKGYIPSARLWGIAAYEGVGKTRFAMDLARRLWFGLEMPDGEPSPFPKETASLWVCSDGQQDDLLEIAEAYGLPDGAVFLNTTPCEPYEGNDIDTRENLARLEAGILCIAPGLVFIDTLTNATGRDLCNASEARAICEPISKIAKRTKTAICLGCHLALNGKALGKRVRGWTRTMLNVECPDPEHPERLKIWAEKTFSKPPAPLGATMGDKGTTYDLNPPVAPEPTRGTRGAPPKAREQAMALIVEALTQTNDQVANELQESLVGKGVAKTTFWRSVDAMAKDGDLLKSGGPNTGSQVMLHLYRRNSGTEAF